MLRAVPGDFDAAIVASIDERLRGIEQDEHARILLAVESGSRGWGFASPDSDYDVRFVYVRDRDRYLSLWPPRDVIETPLDAVYDINGWDLSKALRLLLKGNAVIVEWLTSPIIYRGDRAFRDALAAFAARHADRSGLIRHYRHLGERQYHTYCAQDPVPLKKAFSALRPALVLRWLRTFPDRSVPPMHFPTLVTQSGLPAGLAEFVANLMAHKVSTREMGVAPLPTALRTLIEQEFALAAATVAQSPITAEAADAADALFRSMVLTEA